MSQLRIPYSILTWTDFTKRIQTHYASHIGFLMHRYIFWFSFSFFFSRNCDPLFQLLNNTLKLEESIPDYYNGQVLLRSSPNYPQTFSGELRFQTLFHIIVIWMSVFIGLSKGLKSYGKVVYIFSIASLLGFSVFAIKVIGLLPFESFKFWINSTQWLDLLHNGDVSCF